MISLISLISEYLKRHQRSRKLVLSFIQNSKARPVSDEEGNEGFAAYAKPAAREKVTFWREEKTKSQAKVW